MSFIEILLIALSLALDVGVVSVGAGALNRLTLRRTFLIAFVLGTMHALMPLVGWGIGYWFSEYLLAYGRVIGFVLILIVGLKMLKEALGSEDLDQERNILDTKVFILLAFATSIDALVIGFTFSLFPTSIPLAVATIGLVSFVVSLLGSYVGGKSRHLVGRKIEIVGAVALILLAFKTLLF